MALASSAKAEELEQYKHIANLIKGLDSLVSTQNPGVAVKGPLMTIDGFSLAAADQGFPALSASFAITTYLVPPQQGHPPPNRPGEQGCRSQGEQLNVRVGTCRPDLFDDGRKGNAIGAQFIGIDINLVLLDESPDGRDFGNTWNGFELIT